ncbi:hypothetical protein B5P43_36780 [Bacillus sp. SRB_336]|nr:hypothetical protein B5P43_36780 [Bacillus sp. SRB_336]
MGVVDSGGRRGRFRRRSEIWSAEMVTASRSTSRQARRMLTCKAVSAGRSVMLRNVLAGAVVVEA